MGRKPTVQAETSDEISKKRRGRPKKDSELTETNVKKAKATTHKKGDPIMSLEEVENELLKKAKINGVISQSEIYESLNTYELDDDAINDLMDFFASHDIEVTNEEEDEEEEDDNDLDKIDDSKINLEEPVEDDDFFADESLNKDEEEEEDIDVDNINASLGSEVRVNDSVKMYLKEIGKFSLLKPEEEPIIAKKADEGDMEAKQELINRNLRLVVNIANIMLDVVWLFLT